MGTNSTPNWNEQVAIITDGADGWGFTLAEFAALAEFVVSPENSFTTGFTFDLSGGRATY